MSESDPDFAYDVEMDAETLDVRLSAPDHKEELSAAATGAVVAADHLRRYYTDSDLAAMFDTAGRFVNDVMQVDTVIQGQRESGEDEEPTPAKGEIADLYLLEMASLWMSLSEGEDSEFYRAARFFRQVRLDAEDDRPWEPEEVHDDQKVEHGYWEHREDRA